MVKKKKKKVAAKKKKQAIEMLLVASKTKDALKAYDVNVAADALDNLNLMVYWYIEQAAKRAAENGRKTVRGHDFAIM
ncbi:MAG: hypothetical protein OXT67_00370 [Zetaproteobacteria bacterium]|nr:hypothetical protein [Zetaproteobacteria bacterium]